MIYFYIFIFLIIILFYFYYKDFRTIEKFEDKFDDFEKYDEIYDSEFTDLYEIIYRDFSDIEKDIKVIEEYIPNLNQNDLSIAVLGSGVGKLCKFLKEKNKNVIGVDISENMLKKAQSIYPNIKFIRGNITKEKIFNSCDEEKINNTIIKIENFIKLR